MTKVRTRCRRHSAFQLVYVCHHLSFRYCTDILHRRDSPRDIQILDEDRIEESQLKRHKLMNAIFFILGCGVCDRHRDKKLALINDLFGHFASSHFIDMTLIRHSFLDETGQSAIQVDFSPIGSRKSGSSSALRLEWWSKDVASPLVSRVPRSQDLSALNPADAFDLQLGSIMYRTTLVCVRNNQLSQGGFNGVNFCLSFLDDTGRVQDEWKANFETEHTAICWMWMVGGVWALKHDWSVMELWCRRCCAARVATCPRVAWGKRMLYRASPSASSKASQQIGAAATSCNAYHPHRGT